MTEELFIVGAKRTVFGRYRGKLAGFSPVDLAVAAGQPVLEGAGRPPVDAVVLGNVLSAGHGMNIARQVTLKLELPQATPAMTVNQMCASGLASVITASHMIRAGDADLVLCGGTESMSQAAFLLRQGRNGLPLGGARLEDSILCDGLTDPLHREHMALTAERLAGARGITRQHQDAYAAGSQSRWAAAEEARVFESERVPLGDLETDEHPRPSTTEEVLAGLKPGFDPEGAITAGNASGINDGAGLLLLASSSAVRRHALTPMARFAGGLTVGCDPREMGLGPVHALQALEKKVGRGVREHDLIEVNEAFAAQVLSCCHDLKLDHDRINRHGGAIAMGHPIGASGARLLVHLAHQLAAGQGHHGTAALCVGGGMGIAASLEGI